MNKEKEIKIIDPMTIEILLKFYWSNQKSMVFEKISKNKKGMIVNKALIIVFKAMVIFPRHIRGLNQKNLFWKMEEVIAEVFKVSRKKELLLMRKKIVIR